MYLVAQRKKKGPLGQIGVLHVDTHGCITICGHVHAFKSVQRKLLEQYQTRPMQHQFKFVLHPSSFQYNSIKPYACLVVFLPEHRLFYSI